MNGRVPTSREWWAAALAVAWFAFAPGCASPEGAESGTEAKPSGREEHRNVYGDDPMGVARRWADGPPESAPDGVRRRVDGWKEPAVLRVARRDDGSYRALVGDRTAANGRAVLLVIVRTDGAWRVDRAESGSGRYLWPEM